LVDTALGARLGWGDGRGPSVPEGALPRLQVPDTVTSPR
jgi:hypothetical protein